ncbi:MAG: hypothetical protein KF716_03475 [Anaerolineae bacterium]|nr:hypothetical protein [Anaerolineae bacterium]
MRPFDEGYMERREKQIRDAFMLQAVSRALGLISLALIVALLVSAQWGLVFTIVLGSILLGTGTGAIVTSAIASAQTAADRAIQKEHAQLAELYGQAAEKPKRHAAVRLTDDGELIPDDDASLNVSSNGHSQYQSTK